MVPQVRIELTTYRLQGGCSTSELQGQIWRSQGVTIPFFSSDSATCVHEHFETKLVEMVGFEPTMPEAADLQSAGVTNFPTLPLHIETH